MPPRKSQKESASEKTESSATTKKSVQKRKARDDGTDQKKKESKTSRRSGRTNAIETPQLLNYILSDSCTALCRPKYENADTNQRTYTGTVPLTPFEELLSAVVLSRPISHALGQRGIRTLLNDPYNFRTPAALRAGGEDKILQALVDAKTQHKGKTAQQLAALADVVVKQGWQSNEKSNDLVGLKKQMNTQASEEDDTAVETLTQIVTTAIKGMGPTAANIFIRRIQSIWSELYPFVDNRTATSLKAIGLPESASELERVIGDAWPDIDKKNRQGSGDADAKRLVFVRILERAIMADLEGKTAELLENARKA